MTQEIVVSANPTSAGLRIIIGRGPQPIRFALEHLRANLEAARQLATHPEAILSAVASVHNADVLDRSPLPVRWTCPRPKPPTLGDGTPVDGFAFKTQPYAHQREGFERARDASAFAFLMDMGTGKTKVTIDNAAWLWTQGRIDACIVLAPKGVHTQWIAQQVPAHCSVPSVGVAVSLQRLGKRATAALEAALEEPGLRFVAINTEAVVSERAVALLEGILKRQRCMLVVDEAHYIKNPTAARTKAITKLGRLAHYRRILTGTPVTRGTEDLFSQYRFLDPNIIGCQTFSAFTTAYCVRGGFENRQIVGYRNLERLRALIAPYTHRVRKDECLDLPPKVYTTREVPLSDEQRDAYNEARAAFNEAAESENFDIQHAIVLVTRLRQVVGGHLPDGRALACPRVDVVADIVRETAGRVVVWAVHRHEVVRLCAELRKQRDRRVFAYDGHTTDAQRDEALRAYAEDESTVLVANPAAGGTGLNLDGASTVVYYSHTFNAAHRWQSEDRTHRATTRHSVTYVDLYAPRTIEQRVLAALRRKQDLAAMSVADLRAMVTGDDGDDDSLALFRSA